MPVVVPLWLLPDLRPGLYSAVAEALPPWEAEVIAWVLVAVGPGGARQEWWVGPLGDGPLRCHTVPQDGRGLLALLEASVDETEAERRWRALVAEADRRLRWACLGIERVRTTQVDGRPEWVIEPAPSYEEALRARMALGSAPVRP